MKDGTWLAQLAPAHAPPPPGWWPPAPGWWGLLALVVLLVTALAWWLRHPRRRLRRAAIRELRQLERGGVDDAALARGVEYLLRRYAVSRYGRETVAALTGEDWLAFVIAHGGHAWAGDPGRNLLRAAYGARSVADRQSWVRGARGFLSRR
ncbi:MAG: DUF4381 family protein [Betaproteobacteria bacterium]|nr:DUF4381 family protein [Betaproteobacteria bacterium]